MDAKGLELRPHNQAWICSVCNTLWFDRDLAERCCRPAQCRVCGRSASVGNSICVNCTEQQRLVTDEIRFRAADKIWHGDYEKAFIFWEGPEEKGGFFRNRTALEAYCVRERLPPPRWAWACEQVRFLLDAEEALMHARDHQNRPVRDLISDVDVETLQSVLDDWAMRLDLKSYDVDYELAVLFDRALLDATQSK